MQASTLVYLFMVTNGWKTQEQMRSGENVIENMLRNMKENAQLTGGKEMVRRNGLPKSLERSLSNLMRSQNAANLENGAANNQSPFKWSPLF